MRHGVGNLPWASESELLIAKGQESHGSKQEQSNQSNEFQINR